MAQTSRAGITDEIVVNGDDTEDLPEGVKGPDPAQWGPEARAERIGEVNDED
jgi:hypothetical protein